MSFLSSLSLSLSLSLGLKMREKREMVCLLANSDFIMHDFYVPCDNIP